jgi:crotonobetainyl-CoA:carnitine CoA-transferase CaiB-like acyl-CoA transferase
LHRMFQWADLVHHSSRIGLAERLGYDEETVRAVNPNVVYSHASGFGPLGPKARLPANDHLIQALSGIEAAAGGDGQAPTHLPAAPVDRTNGWLAATAMLAGLYARRRNGVPQSVTSILLGAGMTLKSGVFLTADRSVEGPLLDHHQTGYGAAYRLYRGSDGAWFALAVLDAAAWRAVRGVTADPNLPDRPPPLRSRRGERQPAEELLESTFARRPASAWVSELRRAGVAVEPVAEADRVQFIASILDDPVNRQLGRVLAFDWGPRGCLETLTLPLRFGPGPGLTPPAFIPRLGQHTDEVLSRLGFDEAERAKLADASIVASS